MYSEAVSKIFNQLTATKGIHLFGERVVTAIINE